MFSRRPSQSHSHSRSESFSARYRAGKANSRSRKSFRGGEPAAMLRCSEYPENSQSSRSKTLTSAIVTICVGPERRLFAAHEEILAMSPFFSASCRGQIPEAGNKTIHLPNEQAEVLSSILEYLYKGDYFPRLVYNKRRNIWDLESAVDANGALQYSMAALLFHNDHRARNLTLLSQTSCAAERYGLSDLKRLSLRKQGLQSAIQCSTILSSARYAYANTPDNDSKLRAHYLALIIRSRSTFKRSGTMQMEMEAGGKLFFDLFVAMCNHMDDISPPSKPQLFR
ncbi:hypothetical protein LOZ05_001881 [Ophidiomyces ophidiicola]|nr:hypothetical protein LOZ38_000777 [Ophidiomyces ophidiicola]KAI2080505.1 hypothetical protein LOZ37_001505 [Ophidiomyces ophidiicola]KAI2158952.1 hypothetical protein LOZ25_003202 [Ophidiomyces ophidiicola]KAI2184791.1 hypothetical protein LOZ22_002110 [Ophidiomyces ophidiicola]KAI2192505.1 hypothetical protein LOZ21_001012 [Ophidiomyces ophidiicola]